MKAPCFSYARAESVEDALALLAEAGEDAKLLAGGQSLVPLLAYRLVRPSHLVDIDALEELRGITVEPGAIALGALTRHAELERARFAGGHRLVAEAASLIGHVPIRARGTLGGSVAHGDPAAELPVALLALDASVHLRSLAGTRCLTAREFFTGPFLTALAHGEVVTRITIPGAPGEVAAFEEFAPGAGDFALASAAVVARVRGGVLERVRIALGGVDATPVRSPAAEQVLEGTTGSEARLAEAARAAAAECDPASDSSTSAGYRRRLVARLLADALRRLREPA